MRMRSILTCVLTADDVTYCLWTAPIYDYFVGTFFSSKLGFLCERRKKKHREQTGHSCCGKCMKKCWTCEGQFTWLELLPCAFCKLHMPLSTVCLTWRTWGRCLLEKGGGFAVGIFPEGWVLSQGCHIQIAISLSHTGDNKEIWCFCKGYVGGWYIGLYSRYGGLFH